MGAYNSEVLSLQDLRERAVEGKLQKPAIYFLFDGDDLLYVGEARCLSARVVAHFQARDRGEIEFDAWSYVDAPADDQKRRDLEGLYIARLRPTLNRRRWETCKAPGCDETFLPEYGLCSKHRGRKRKHGHFLWGRNECCLCGDLFRYLITPGNKFAYRCTDCRYAKCDRCGTRFSPRTDESRKYCSQQCKTELNRDRPWRSGTSQRRLAV